MNLIKFLLAIAIIAAPSFAQRYLRVVPTAGDLLSQNTNNTTEPFIYAGGSGAIGDNAAGFFYFSGSATNATNTTTVFAAPYGSATGRWLAAGSVVPGITSTNVLLYLTSSNTWAATTLNGLTLTNGQLTATPAPTNTITGATPLSQNTFPIVDSTGTNLVNGPMSANGTNAALTGLFSANSAQLTNIGASKLIGTDTNYLLTPVTIGSNLSFSNATLNTAGTVVKTNQFNTNQFTVDATPTVTLKDTANVTNLQIYGKTVVPAGTANKFQINYNSTPTIYWSIQPQGSGSIIYSDYEDGGAGGDFVWAENGVWAAMLSAGPTYAFHNGADPNGQYGNPIFTINASASNPYVLLGPNNLTTSSTKSFPYISTISGIPSSQPVSVMGETSLFFDIATNHNVLVFHEPQNNRWDLIPTIDYPNPPTNSHLIFLDGSNGYFSLGDSRYYRDGNGNLVLDHSLIPSSIGSGKLLRTDSSGIEGAVTIGAGLSFDGTNLTVTAVPGQAPTNTITGTTPLTQNIFPIIDASGTNLVNGPITANGTNATLTGDFLANGATFSNIVSFLSAQNFKSVNITNGITISSATPFFLVDATNNNVETGFNFTNGVNSGGFLYIPRTGGSVPTNAPPASKLGNGLLSPIVHQDALADESLFIYSPRASAWYASPIITSLNAGGPVEGLAAFQNHTIYNSQVTAINGDLNAHNINVTNTITVNGDLGVKTTWTRWNGTSVISSLYQNSTTNFSSTGLSSTLALATGQYWSFHAVLFVTADAIGGQKYQINGSLTVGTLIADIIIRDFDTVTVDKESRVTAFASPVSLSGSHTTYEVDIKGMINPITNGGTFEIDAAENNATGSLQIQKGSYMIMQVLF